MGHERGEFGLSSDRRRRIEERLRPRQAAALRTIEGSKSGAVIELEVGAGKTLIGILTSQTFKRPLYCAPVGLLHQVREEARKWDLRCPRLLSYGLLSQERAAQLLRKLRPDMLWLDEAHMLRILRSARTQVLIQYWEAYSPTIYVASGTLIDDRPDTFAHLIHMAIPEQGVLTLDKYWLSSWTRILAGEASKNDWIRLKLPRTTYKAARARFRQLMESQNGVVLRAPHTLGNSLRFTRLNDIPYPQGTYERISENNRRPDREYFPDALSLYRCLQQVSWGFYLRWTEKRPEEWLLARLELNREVRRRIGTSEVLSAKPVLRQMQQQAHPLWIAWDEARNTWGDVPPTEVIWVNRKPILALAQLLDRPGVVWVRSLALVELLKAWGLAHCSTGKRGQIVWASVLSDYQGRNLQDRWSHNWVLEPPLNAERWEQMIGRTLRDGQRDPVVTVDIAHHTPVLRRLLSRAKKRARGLRDLQIENRLVTGDWVA